MRSSAYYLYLDLFVSGRYIAFISGFVVLATTVLSLVLYSLLMLKPMPLPQLSLDFTAPRPAAHFALRSKPAGTAIKTTAPGHQTSHPIPIRILLLVALLAAIPLVAAREQQIFRRGAHSIGPPARGTIPITLPARAGYPRNYSFDPVPFLAGPALAPVHSPNGGPP